MNFPRTDEITIKRNYHIFQEITRKSKAKYLIISIIHLNIQFILIFLLILLEQNAGKNDSYNLKTFTKIIKLVYLFFFIVNIYGVSQCRSVHRK